MKNNYKIAKTGKPGKKGAESTANQPHIDGQKAIQADELIELMVKSTNLPKSDIEQVLYLFTKEISEMLIDNYSVEIPGMGTFSLALQDINDRELEDIIEEKIKENRRGLPPKQKFET